MHKAAVIRRKVDGKQSMRAVAAVGENRTRPTPGPEHIRDGPDLLDGGSMLSIRGADAGWARWIGVYKQPPASHNVTVGRRGIALAHTAKAVLGTSQ